MTAPTLTGVPLPGEVCAHDFADLGLGAVTPCAVLGSKTKNRDHLHCGLCSPCFLHMNVRLNNMFFSWFLIFVGSTFIQLVLIFRSTSIKRIRLDESYLFLNLLGPVGSCRFLPPPESSVILSNKLDLCGVQVVRADV